MKQLIEEAEERGNKRTAHNIVMAMADSDVAAAEQEERARKTAEGGEEGS